MKVSDGGNIAWPSPVLLRPQHKASLSPIAADIRTSLASNGPFKVDRAGEHGAWALGDRRVLLPRLSMAPRPKNGRNALIRGVRIIKQADAKLSRSQIASG